ncbi:unnamed protein product [Pedinophyceae sp. YPF-701]|nr:unnamed protein product [Pedinophyceae sp. YPF-701]
MAAERDPYAEGAPLSLVFDKCRSLVREADDWPASDPDTRSKLDDAVALVKRCSELVRKADLFSSNEDVDDVATAHLKYLLLSFFLGQLLAKTTERDPAARSGALKQAGAILGLFLSQLQRMRLLPKVYARAAGLDEDADEGEGAAGNDKKDPVQARNDKIARFKRSREIDSRLAAIEAKRALTRRPGDGDDAQDAPDLDEEDERDLWLLAIEGAVITTLDMRATLAQEVEILAHAAARDGGDRAPREDVVVGPRGERMQRGEAQAAVLEKLRGIVPTLKGSTADVAARREQMVASAVLQPFHNAPTMSLREYAEREVRDAEERAARADAAEGARRAREADSSEDEDELRQKRAFDDFKDENPRGWGNSSIKPLR